MLISAYETGIPGADVMVQAVCLSNQNSSRFGPPLIIKRESVHPTADAFCGASVCSK